MRVRDRRGFALILVLLASAAVFALAMHSAVMFRAATVESRVMVERAEAERGARSAAAMVIVGLGTTVERYAGQASAAGSGASGSGSSSAPADEEKPSVELPPMLKELLKSAGKDIEDEAKKSQKDVGRAAQGGGVSGQVRGGRAVEKVRLAAIPSSAVPVRLKEDGPTYFVSITDAAALLSINAAPREQLIAYFTAKGVAPEVVGSLASQIIDWRDEDDFAEPGGAEQARYTPEGVECRNAPFEMVEELLYLPAMTREVYRLVRPDVTVVGDGSIHIGSASREVLLSMPGMSGDVVAAIFEARSAMPITREALERILPLNLRDSIEKFAFDPSEVLRVRVDVQGDSSITFEGIAVMSGRGGIRALGLRAVL